MSLQKFKLKTANTVISADNANLQTMVANEKQQLFDLFSLSDQKKDDNNDDDDNDKATSIRNILQNMPDLWDDKQYEDEYDVQNYAKKNSEEK